jgi:radical SAM protein with 4Fe4S-binding SPASM domain
MFETAAQIRPDFLVLYLSWFTTEEAGRRHAAILKNDLGVDAQTWKSYLGQNTGIDAQKVKTSQEKMRQKRLPFPWFHIPSIPMEQIPAYYADPADPLGYGPCVAPYWMVDIMPNGDVTTCRDYIDVKVGNIKEKPLLEIWNDAPFRAFRQTLQKHNGLLPQCTRCCGLMGF